MLPVSSPSMSHLAGPSIGCCILQQKPTTLVPRTTISNHIYLNRSQVKLNFDFDVKGQGETATEHLARQRPRRRPNQRLENSRFGPEIESGKRTTRS